MDWLNYFECNRAARLPIAWEQGIRVEPHLRAPLIASLQRFQVGESGEGAHIKGYAAETGDARYTRAVHLFIAEEQHHAAMLAGILRELAAPLLSGHWSDRIFILLRRFSGLHREIMVLMVAEIIAQRYYRILFEATRDPVLRTIFLQILRDEHGHVAFHVDTLRDAFAPRPLFARLVLRMVWQLLFSAACLVVLLDHRGVLRAARIGPGAFWRDCHRLFTRATRRVFAAPAPGRLPAEAPARTTPAHHRLTLGPQPSEAAAFTTSSPSDS